MLKKSIYILNALFFVLIISSCSWDLISEPSISQIAGSNSNSTSVLESPGNISATQGGYRNVTLTWDSADDAVQYYIYQAETPFDTFTQVAETKGAVNSISITEEAGVTAYYAITTVNKSSTESSRSIIVSGSTLAAPVITSISSGSDGKTSTVNWWMSNCSSSTYLSSVQYEINCYAEDKSTVVSTLNASGSTNSVTFTGLSPNTNYYYQVEAFTTLNQSNVEKSSMLDEETAHRLIPDAPEDLSLAQGTSSSGVEVSFTLPDFVDYAERSSTYVSHPLYFTIQRKLLGSDDDTYVTLVTYLGTVTEDTDTTTDTKMYFSCKDSTTSSENLTVTPCTSPESTSDTYTAYIPGSTVTWSDTSAVRGKQYTYRVQSYTDDSSSTVSSDESYSEADGWLISTASFKTVGDYTLSEDEKAYTSIKVSYTLDFEDYDVSYKYMLSYIKTGFEENAVSDSEVLLKSFESLDAVNSYAYTFTSTMLSDNNISETQGYYKYKLYILSQSATELPSSEDEYYTYLASPNSITITNNPSLMPEISNFSVQDGYSTKFILSWDYDENCSYTLSWKNYDDEDTCTDETEETLSLEKSDLTISDGKASYSHSASSGDCRLYTLIADNGLKTSSTYESVSCTLGTPDVSFKTYDYDSITVTWDAVQRAKTSVSDYTVSAVYDDDTETELIQTSDSDSEGYTEITAVYNTDETAITGYRCTITKPTGYNDATISGKPITLKITAASSVQEGETTCGKQSVCTVGPALLSTSKGSTMSENIKISWSEVSGASSYIIYRVRYTDGEASSLAEQTDTYYYDADEETLTIGGDASDSSRAYVTLSGATFTLTDIYAEQDDTTSSYELNQSMISWGLPYGYIVLPVIDGGSSSDFVFDSSSLLELSSSSKVQYSNISDTKNATYGYGLNLRAYKSESSTTQTIEWETPYYSTSTPSLYYREAGSSTNSWTKLSTSVSSGATSLSFTPLSTTDAYEYAIAYAKTSSTLTLPESFVNGTTSNSGLSTLETDGENYDYSGRTIEKLNKGYLLAVSYSASYGGTQNSDGTYASDEKYYSEMVNWDEWDYDERSIGPDSAYISIRNYNLNSGWTKLASLDSDLHYESSETVDNTTLWNSGYVTLYACPTAVPTADTVNSSSLLNATGPLMVLRDAKHYYSLTLERGSVSVTLGSDGSVYAYRQISDAELARCALLALAYGFYLHDGGLASYSNVDSQFKYSNSGSLSSTNGGTMSFTDGQSWNVGKYKAWYSLTNNYAPSQLTPGGVSATCVGLTAGSKFTGCFRIKGLSDYYLYRFADTDYIDIATADDDNPLDYSATISFISENQDDLTLKITRNSTTTTLCDTNDNTIRKNWFPMQIHSDTKYVITNSYYGWWPKE